MRIVTLQHVVMGRGCYIPSQINKPKQITYVEFLAKYSDHPLPIMVSSDGKSNPQLITAYRFGLDCWYIVVDSINQPETATLLESEE